MAFGKPIIACEKEGIGEVVQDGIQGFLVKRQDVVSLANALEKILSNEKLGSSLGKGGRVLVEKELNWNRIATQIIDLYRQIVA